LEKRLLKHITDEGGAAKELHEKRSKSRRKRRITHCLTPFPAEEVKYPNIKI